MAKAAQPAARSIVKLLTPTSRKRIPQRMTKPTTVSSPSAPAATASQAPTCSSNGSETMERLGKRTYIAPTPDKNRRRRWGD